MNKTSEGCILLLALALLAATACVDSPPSHPNILLVSLDTLRPDHLGLYGYERPTSPHLDAFAAGSVVFENAVSTSSWTLPSHASMFTGLYPSAHGAVTHERMIPPTVSLMTEQLEEAGYLTAGFTGGAFLARHYGFHRGFQTYVDGTEGGRMSGYMGALMEWVDALERDRPFFLFLHCYDIHSPYSAPDPVHERMFVEESDLLWNENARKLLDRWNSRRELNEDDLSILRSLRLKFTGRKPVADLGRLEDPQGFFKALRASQKKGDRKVAENVPPAHTVEYLSRLYDGEISYVDDLLHMVLSRLESEGHLDQSLLIITSDHGEEFGDHGSLGHRETLYDELLRIPLIVRFPDGSGNGIRVQEQVRLVDIPATILRAAGIEVSEENQGIDLRSILDGENQPLPAYSEVGWGGNPGFASVRFLQQKLILNRETGGLQLFDIATDPGEFNSLSDLHSLDGKTLRDLLMERAEEDRILAERHSISAAEIDEATREQLEALGYLD